MKFVAICLFAFDVVLLTAACGVSCVRTLEEDVHRTRAEAEAIIPPDMPIVAIDACSTPKFGRCNTTYYLATDAANFESDSRRLGDILDARGWIELEFAPVRGGILASYAHDDRGRVSIRFRSPEGVASCIAETSAPCPATVTFDAR